MSDEPGVGALLLNVLWVVLAGFWLFLGYVAAGIVMMLTIIGIPFGVQAFKLAGYSLWPFGRVVVRRPGGTGALRVVGNVIWFLVGGIWLALAHVVTGLVLCLTIVGIPLGIGNLKLVPLALFPFGADVARKGAVTPGEVVAGF